MYPEPKNSPWGKVQTCKEICDGVFNVTAAGHGGIMVKNKVADSLLTPEAQACGFKESSYLCFEEDCCAAVAERELLDKGIMSVLRHHKDKAAYETILNESIQRHFPEYWQSYEQRLLDGWTPLKQQLFDRLDKNLADYRAHIMGFDKLSIIEMADRISTVGDAHMYLNNHYEFKNESEILYLLQFQNPLEIVADEWELRRQDISDMSFAIERIFDSRDADWDYPLMTDPPAQPVTPEKTGKQSLLEQIKDNAEKLKARDAATRTTQSRRDKEKTLD